MSWPFKVTRLEKEEYLASLLGGAVNHAHYRHWLTLKPDSLIDALYLASPAGREMTSRMHMNRGDHRIQEVA